MKSLPNYSSLFWPPPMWISPNHKLKLFGTFLTASNRLLKGIFYDELKANYHEFLFPVKAMAAGDHFRFTKQEFLKMFKNIEMFLKFLNDIVEEVKKETEIIHRSIRDNALARRQLPRDEISQRLNTLSFVGARCWYDWSNS